MSKLTKELIDQFFVDRFQTFESQLNGESKKPLHSHRKAAIKNFEELGFPVARSEEYKYTNIAKAFSKYINLDGLNEQSVSEIKDIERYFIPELEAINIVFINGHLSTELSDIDNLPEGLVIETMKSAQESYSADLEQHFNTHQIEGSDNFSILNTAFAQGGAFIKVHKSTLIEKPIACYYFNDTQNGDVISQPRNLIIAEANAQLTVIEDYISIGSHTSFTNAVTEIVMEDEVVFNHYKLQNDSDQSIQVGATLVHQLGKSVLNAGTFSFSGAMVRNNLSIAVHKEHSETNMLGLYFLNGNSHVDNHTVVDHRVANCESNELYKGILDDKSKGVFNGKIFVRRPAQKTNAFQSNRNILLSDGAEMDTKPQLEIWADDVKCSHGCTVGQLDKDQYFYLQARGLDKKTARSILLNAFASDVVSQVKVEALRNLIENKITERL